MRAEGGAQAKCVQERGEGEERAKNYNGRNITVFDVQPNPVERGRGEAGADVERNQHRRVSGGGIIHGFVRQETRSAGHRGGRRGGRHGEGNACQHRVAVVEQVKQPPGLQRHTVIKLAELRCFSDAAVKGAGTGGCGGVRVGGGLGFGFTPLAKGKAKETLPVLRTVVQAVFPPHTSSMEKLENENKDSNITAKVHCQVVLAVPEPGVLPCTSRESERLNRNNLERIIGRRMTSGYIPSQSRAVAVPAPMSKVETMVEDKLERVIGQCKWDTAKDSAQILPTCR